MEFCSAYHPSLKYTFEISESSLSFLDLCLSISDATITMTIHYKPTDTHSYLDYSSSHPPHCKKAIPYGQFLRLRRICSDDDEYEAKSKEMASFFENRGYPRSVVTNSQRRTQEISRERALGNSGRGHRARCAEKIPLVFTYHSKNQEVKKILLKNFRILSDDPTTKEIFNTKPLCVYRRDTSQVSETSWFMALCRLALMISKPHQREHFLAIDPGAAYVTSREGQQKTPTPTEMFG